MTQPKLLEKNLQPARECASSVDSRVKSANYSASHQTKSNDQEIQTTVELATQAITFSGDQQGKILHLFPQSALSIVPQHIRDLETLKPSKLNQAYKKEYTSWRSRRRYAQKKGIAFHPPWADFRNYLRELGPIPSEGYTLDKIVPEKGYVPGNVRWASKETQTHNRPNTIWLIYKGERLPLGVWAKRIGKAESTLRSRRNKGWPDENVITGHPPEKFMIPPHGHPWPVGHAKQWERKYQRETGGHTSRFKFLGLLTAKRLIELSEEANLLCFPDYYTPTPEEEEALDRCIEATNYWLRFWKHIQRERVKLCGEPFLNTKECVRLCS